MKDFDEHMSKCLRVTYAVMIPLHIVIIVLAIFNPYNIFDGDPSGGERVGLIVAWFFVSDILAIFAVLGVAAMTMPEHWIAKMILYPIAFIAWLAIIAGAGGIVALPIFLMGVCITP